MFQAGFLRGCVLSRSRTGQSARGGGSEAEAGTKIELGQVWYGSATRDLLWGGTVGGAVSIPFFGVRSGLGSKLWVFGEGVRFEAAR